MGRRYQEYNNLRRHLKDVLAEHGLSDRPGVLASILLEAFIHLGGKITNQLLIPRGVIIDGEYMQWRARMGKAGILSWDDDWKYGARFQPGPEIARYIAKERQAPNRLKERLEAEIRAIIEHYDPPYTEEKRRLAVDGGGIGSLDLQAGRKGA